MMSDDLQRRADEIHDADRAEDANRPRRLTPTERAHEIMLAALHRTPVKASEEVEINRSTANGEYGFRVAGVAGEADDLATVAARVLSIAKSLDDDLPLSRAMHYKRDYLPDEKGKK